MDQSVFRIDHDEALEQTTNVRYQHDKRGPWASFNWHYESGLVAGDVSDPASALALTADEQHAIGFNCNGVYATITAPITSCAGSNWGAEELYGRVGFNF